MIKGECLCDCGLYFTPDNLIALFVSAMSQVSQNNRIHIILCNAVADLEI